LKLGIIERSLDYFRLKTDATEIVVPFNTLFFMDDIPILTNKDKYNYLTPTQISEHTEVILADEMVGFSTCTGDGCVVINNECTVKKDTLVLNCSSYNMGLAIGIKGQNIKELLKKINVEFGIKFKRIELIPVEINNLKLAS
jgi:hypothetical protein